MGGGRGCGDVTRCGIGRGGKGVRAGAGVVLCCALPEEVMACGYVWVPVRACGWWSGCAEAVGWMATAGSCKPMCPGPLTHLKMCAAGILAGHRYIQGKRRNTTRCSTHSTASDSSREMVTSLTTASTQKNSCRCGGEQGAASEDSGLINCQV